MHPLEDEDDEIDTPSAEDLYIDLEHEMSKISPYTCPTRVRILLQKIAFKVHKEKDPGKLLFLFWITHLSTLVVECIIQKRYVSVCKKVSRLKMEKLCN